MKICTKCKKEKKQDEFNLRNSKLNIFQSECRACVGNRTKMHYKNNPAYYKEKASRHHRKTKEEKQKFICDFLSVHPCIDCGEPDIVVLEFDHRGDKKWAISMMGNCSLKKLIFEMGKCDVRCANCHRKKTAKQLNYYRIRYRNDLMV